MENLLNLKVETSKLDFDAFYSHTASKLLKSYTWIPLLQNVFIWVVLAFSFTSFFQFQSGEISKTLFYSILTVSISFLLYVALGKFMETKTAQCFTPNENGIMIGPKEFEITPFGIKETHPFGSSFYHWDVVQNIEEVNGSIYVYVDKVLALIFNSESFESSEYKEALLSEIKKYV